MNISFLGSSEGLPQDPMYKAMYTAARLVTEQGHEVITGGFGGSGMEAPCKGATEAGGKPYGITMRGKAPNQYVARTVDVQNEFQVAGRMSGSLVPEIQYGIRLGYLLTSDAFIIGAHAWLGAMTELLAIANLNAKMWSTEPKRCAVLHPRELSFGEVTWIAQAIQQGVSPTWRVDWHDWLQICTSPEGAVAWVLKQDQQQATS